LIGLGEADTRTVGPQGGQEGRGACAEEGSSAKKKNVPSDLPPCPTAASKLSGLAVEPILDILSDRL